MWLRLSVCYIWKYFTTGLSNLYLQCVRPWDGQSSCSGPHSILSNKFPIGKYSGVLLPFLHSNFSQALVGRHAAQHIKLALNFLLIFSRSDSMKIGFNSLAAGASVNHLHFQFWSIPIKLPVELAKCERIWNNKGVFFFRSYHLIPSFVLRFAPSLVSHAASLISPVVSWLTNNNIPFNLLMAQDFDVPTSRSIGLYLMPRQPTSSSSMIASVLPPGFPEISGLVIATDSETFEQLSSELVISHYKAELAQPKEVLRSIFKEFDKVRTF